ncbi:MAG: TetR/AcrR family transcriptional regulator [Acidimicrobiales bacterium]
MTESRSEAEHSTAVALLDAAETAFAEEGVDKVSLRAIMRSAGANTAAVHYHYGSRDELAMAVLDRVLEPLQARRLELLDELVESAAARETAPRVDELVEALIRPDFEAVIAVADRNPEGARIIGTIYARPSAFVKSFVSASFAPVASRFLPHLRVALPDLGTQELAWRIRWGLFGILGALLCDDDTIITPKTLEAELAHVVVVTVGAVSARPSRSQARD